MPVSQPRVAMITGGNSGIGFATVTKLAAQGLHVILASRNQQSSAQAIARIHAGNPDARVESIPLDLASFELGAAVCSSLSRKGLSAAPLNQQRGRGRARQTCQLYR